MTQTHSQRGLALAAAIRAKQNWPVKLLDEQRGVDQKWANEGKLLHQIDPDDVDRTIRELKREASRILSLDPVIRNEINIPADTYDWTAIDADIEAARERMRQFKYAVREPALKEHVGVRTADDLVPPSLHRVLEGELNRLADVGVKDFHPGSDGKVQDLIHPSLYPYVRGITRILDTHHPLNHAEIFQTVTRYPVDEYSEGMTEHKSTYAWLPSLFAISDEGKVTIDSPINALGPRFEHPALYKALERLFELALPQIEESMFYQWKYETSPSFRRWEERSEERQSGDIKKLQEKIEEQKKEKSLENQTRAERERIMKDEMEWEKQGTGLGGLQEKSKFAGKKLKVIVKAANYVLLPGQEYEGSWHVEGAPHEHIRASLIYYYSCDADISDKGLSFRRLRTEEDQPNCAKEHGSDFDMWNQETDDSYTDYPSDIEDVNSYPYTLPRNIELGTVSATGIDTEGGTRTGRMLSFPNWLQHQVTGLKNTRAEGNSPAMRKILCFFVVNESWPTLENEVELHFPGFVYSGPHVGPNAPPVLTTANVLPQQRFRIFPYVYNVLDMVCKRTTGGRGLPIELAIYVCDLADAGMTRADAEEHRRRLMDDRKAADRKVNRVWEESYGLCEH
ncbi:hypothetical protein DACRYDRAFT_23879 [Dacryopinax primogenitus]|uniref:DUF4246 domain-containing protein n=1 Tax=Dacryopinax primogenitus (strain DJM 731) TaxID=1858805 RepID=M5FUU3_DACPD|nr:uncharacterized protein DACRYDRAFT_23879 [Dacryopinax primogenitus]EJT99284.1 hypothetical protein DACRYDRAFT_23879 [Dacryopinax primogenitus]